MELIGGIGPEPGPDNVLVGSRAGDIGFGDPFTAGNEIGATDTGLSLTAGHGVSDLLFGHGCADQLFGDAWRIEESGRGGDDWLVGGAGMDRLFGDAAFLQGHGLGGADLISGG